MTVSNIGSFLVAGAAAVVVDIGSSDELQSFPPPTTVLLVPIYERWGIYLTSLLRLVVAPFINQSQKRTFLLLVRYLWRL